MNLFNNKAVTIVAAGLLLLTTDIAVAQDFNFPELKGFKITTDYPVYTPDNLWDYINGAADTFLALGFEDLHIAEYTSGKEIIKVEIYKHENNVLAFGMYSTERFPSYNFIKIGIEGYKTDGQVYFLKGSYYVKVMTNSKSAKTVGFVEPLAYKVVDALSGEINMPELLKAFPAEGKKAYEDTFVQESVLGHGFLTGAYKANYEVDGNSFLIFILEKTSVEESRKSVSAFLSALKLELLDQDGGKYVLADGYNGTVSLSWSGTRIVLINGLPKDRTDIADKYSSLILK